MYVVNTFRASQEKLSKIITQFEKLIRGNCLKHWPYFMTRL